MIAGAPAEAAKELVRRLREEARVIWSCMILVVAEQATASSTARRWEAIAAAQQLAGGGPVSDRCRSARASARVAARARARRRSQEVVTVETPALEPYTPDGFTAALAHVDRRAEAGARRACRTPIRRATLRRSWPRGSTARSSPT